MLLAVINVSTDTPAESLKTGANLFNSGEERRSRGNRKALVILLYMLETKAKAKAKTGCAYHLRWPHRQPRATRGCV